MPLRLVLAYGIIVLVTAAGGFALWVYVIRDRLARRDRRIRRARRSRETPPPTANGSRPAHGAD